MIYFIERRLRDIFYVVGIMSEGVTGDLFHGLKPPGAVCGEYELVVGIFGYAAGINNLVRRWTADNIHCVAGMVNVIAGWSVVL